MKINKYAAIMLVTMAATLAGLKLSQSLASNEPDSARLDEFSLETLDGDLFRSSDWLDKTLVINFWASWCPPCRKEMPDFVKLQDEFASRGVQFVGIAIDDKENAQAFAQEIGINFPVLLGGFQGAEIARGLGNSVGGLPYTVVVRKGGEIVVRHAGGLSYQQLKPKLAELVGG